MPNALEGAAADAQAAAQAYANAKDELHKLIEAQQIYNSTSARQDAIIKQRANIRELGKQAKEAADVFRKAAEDQRRTIEANMKAVQKMKDAFDASIRSIRNWATAGLAGTVQGNYLALSFRMLSMQIASVFLPTINFVTAAVQRLTTFFQGLSGDQQRTIELFVEGALAVRAMGAALTYLGVAAGPLGLILKLLAAFFVGTEQGRNAFGALMESIVALLTEMAALFAPIVDALSAVFNVVMDIFQGVIQLIADVLKFLAWAIKELREFLGLASMAERQAGAKQRSNRQRSDVQMQGGGQMSIAEAFNKIQQAAFKQDAAKIQVQQLDIQKKIERNTRPKGRDHAHQGGGMG